MDCTSGCPTSRGLWSVPEHERFIEAMSLYPRGPWKLITDYVGTRSIKQVQTHAQKYQQKLLRQQRGLRKRKVNVKRPEHRVDETTLDQFTHKCIVRYAQRLGKDHDHDQDYDQDGTLSPRETDDGRLDITDASRSGSGSSSASCSPLSYGRSVDTNLVGATLGDWLAMTKEAAADAKLLELLPEVFAPDDEEEEQVDRGLLKPPPQDWSVLQLDALCRRPPVVQNVARAETSEILLQVSSVPAPSA